VAAPPSAARSGSVASGRRGRPCAFGAQSSAFDQVRTVRCVALMGVPRQTLAGRELDRAPLAIRGRSPPRRTAATTLPTPVASPQPPAPPSAARRPVGPCGLPTRASTRGGSRRQTQLPRSSPAPRTGRSAHPPWARSRPRLSHPGWEARPSPTPKSRALPTDPLQLERTLRAQATTYGTGGVSALRPVRAHLGRSPRPVRRGGSSLDSRLGAKAVARSEPFAGRR
jgi:hypothetical protein